MPAARYYTAEMVRALPEDGNRYETVHGELLVSPSPRRLHQFVLLRLAVVLWKYLEVEGIEALLASPSDVSWSPDTLVQPDLYVIDANQAEADGGAGKPILHLVIEILSPSSKRADRVVKRQLYQEQGIPTYWVVDIDERQVEIWTPEATFPVVERERLTWRYPGAKTECVVALEKIFAGGV